MIAAFDRLRGRTEYFADWMLALFFHGRQKSCLVTPKNPLFSHGARRVAEKVSENEVPDYQTLSFYEVDIIGSYLCLCIFEYFYFSLSFSLSLSLSLCNQGLKWLRKSLISAVAKKFSEVVKFSFRGSQVIKSLFSSADKMSFGRNALRRLFSVFNFLLRFSNGSCKLKTQQYGDNMRASSWNFEVNSVCPPPPVILSPM